ncbi:hypothetical protein BC2230_40801 [Burkholderia cepacia]
MARAPALVVRRRAAGALSRPGAARVAEARGDLRGRRAAGDAGRGRVRGERRAHRVASGRAELLRPLRLHRGADRAGVPVRRRPALADGDRGPRDGYLPPLDGNGRAVDAGRLPGDQRAGRLQRRGAADGDATDRASACRSRRVAARARLRAGGRMGGRAAAGVDGGVIRRPGDSRLRRGQAGGGKPLVLLLFPNVLPGHVTPSPWLGRVARRRGVMSMTRHGMFRVTPRRAVRRRASR